MAGFAAPTTWHNLLARYRNVKCHVEACPVNTLQFLEAVPVTARWLSEHRCKFASFAALSAHPCLPPSTRVTQSGYVLDQAVMHGVISREDYDYLADMRKYRNALAPQSRTARRSFRVQRRLVPRAVSTLPNIATKTRPNDTLMTYERGIIGA